MDHLANRELDKQIKRRNMYEDLKKQCVTGDTLVPGECL